MYKVKSVHQNNIHFLIIEVYRFLNGLSPPIMDDIFRLREHRYNLINFRLFECHNVKTSIYGTETVTYKSSQLWNLVPPEIKNKDSLAQFKYGIKKWILPLQIVQNIYY